MLAKGVGAVDIEHLKAMWLDLQAHVDELAGEHQQYVEFFEQSPEAYLVTAADGSIVEANGAAVDILQRRKRYLRGKPFAALIALDHRPRFRERLRALLSGSPGAERSWRTVIVSPELRTEVNLTARLIGPPQARGGVCWRLDPLA